MQDVEHTRKPIPQVDVVEKSGIMCGLRMETDSCSGGVNRLVSCESWVGVADWFLIRSGSVSFTRMLITSGWGWTSAMISVFSNLSLVTQISFTEPPEGFGGTLVLAVVPGCHGKGEILVVGASSIYHCKEIR